MRRVLVLGATSLIGRRLLGDPPPGVELLAVSRRPPAARAPTPDPTWVAADLADPGLRLPPAEAVLSLSPIWLLAPALPAVLATGARRLVAVSSTSRSPRRSPPSRRNARWPPGSRRARRR